MTTGKTIALTRQIFVSKEMSLLFNMLSCSLISAWMIPFIISCNLGLLITDLSVSAYLGKSLFLFYFLRIVLLDVKFLNGSLFLSALWICHPSAFWPPWLLIRNQIFYWGSLEMMSHFFSLLISRFSFCCCLLTIWLWCI